MSRKDLLGVPFVPPVHAAHESVVRKDLQDIECDIARREFGLVLLASIELLDVHPVQEFSHFASSSLVNIYSRLQFQLEMDG